MKDNSQRKIIRLARKLFPKEIISYISDLRDRIIIYLSSIINLAKLVTSSLNMTLEGSIVAVRERSRLAKKTADTFKIKKNKQKYAIDIRLQFNEVGSRYSFIVLYT